MRVVVDPRRVELPASRRFTVTVTVTNTEDIIGGFAIRMLGADPAWVTLDRDKLSLFPGATQSATATIDLPEGVNAGDRRIAVQVRELTPPQAMSVTQIDLVVPAREALRMELSPMTITCGKHGRFSVIAENTGNTPVSVAPLGMDPEEKIRFSFRPGILDLAPGEQVIADLHTTAKRRWFGSPVIRPFALSAAAPEELDAALAATHADSRDPSSVSVLAAPPPEPPAPLAQGVLVQKPRLGRGVLSMASLLLAVSVFAVVITIALSRLVGVSAADRDLAIQVASARSAGVGTGSSVMSGTVTPATGGDSASGVTIEVYQAGDTTTPVTSTATNDKGAWSVSSLPAGSYKLLFRRAGFVTTWYPKATSASSAQAVTLKTGQHRGDLNVSLPGLPASISGTVQGSNVAGAVLTVAVPTQYLTPVTSTATPSTSAQPSSAPPTVTARRAAATTAAPATPAPPPAGSTSSQGAAVLTTVPISSDGTFDVKNLPSPAVYTLNVTKVGFETASQLVDLSGGEARTGVALVLRTGDGSITGKVTGPNGPLGNAVVTATTGDSTVDTLTLTKGTVGEFRLRGLVTPATYTVTVKAPGYTTVTSTLSLSSGQKLGGVLLSLTRSSGTLHGVVTTVADGKPASGVTVTITSGTSKKLTTVTQSGSTAGAWTAAGLPIPGTYTITFSRSDLQPQTVAVAMDSAGHVTSGASSSGDIAVAMRSAYASVSGIVRQQTGGGSAAAGEATVSLASGDNSYTVTSASTPHSLLGHFEVDHVVPGTYTVSVSRKGTSPTTVILTVTAGQQLTYNPTLVQPASVSGTVTQGGAPLAGADVTLYLSTQYPAKAYQTTTTDAAGHYSFAGVDAPQAYVVEVRTGSSGPLASGTIVLSASQAGVVNLKATS